jgi:hypothetical protein
LSGSGRLVERPAIQRARAGIPAMSAGVDASARISACGLRTIQMLFYLQRKPLFAAMSILSFRVTAVFRGERVCRSEHGAAFYGYLMKLAVTSCLSSRLV